MGMFQTQVRFVQGKKIIKKYFLYIKAVWLVFIKPIHKAAACLKNRFILT